MIARLWHGMTKAEHSDEYLEFLHKSGIPDYRGTSGNRGVSVLRRTEGNRSHFLLISYWDSYEAIRAFAGDEIDNARYYPEDKRWLLEFEPHVIHYDVAVEFKG
jgi:heme-degrading monooxygenase HmoA